VRLSQKKVLITGGSGFIGTNLVNALLDCTDFCITILDSKIPTFIKKSKRLNFVQGDLSDKFLLKNLFAQNSFDIVYHLAWNSIPESSLEDPEEEVKLNLVNSLNLINISYLNSVGKFIFLSSGGTVYGNALYSPIKENHPKSPLNPYGITKLAVEKFIEMHGFLNDFKYIILRPSVPYGPYQNPNSKQGVISVFLNNLIDGKNFIIWGDGENKRDFFFIDDLIDAIIKSSLSVDVYNVIFNVGGLESITINDLVDKMENIFNMKINVKYEPARNFDASDVSLDCSLIQEKLNWKPSTNIDSGIMKTFEWIKKYRK
tara:strand:+ start:1110 stop:2057 length:948 start_codon:yes stop_codon:yes gene_type:complete